MPFKNTEREVADLMLYGIEFHTFAPTKEKQLLLANSVLYFGRRSLFSLSRSE